MDLETKVKIAGFVFFSLFAVWLFPIAMTKRLLSFQADLMLSLAPLFLMSYHTIMIRREQKTWAKNFSTLPLTPFYINNHLYPLKRHYPRRQYFYINRPRTTR